MKRLDNTEEITRLIPIYSTNNAAAADLYATKSVWIDSGDYASVPTGVTGEELFAGLDSHHCALICPRSGLALKQGITVLNSPGIIDFDYKGEVEVVLINHSRRERIIQAGSRIAQVLLVKRAWNFDFEIADTDRTGGFGSTGE